MSFFSVCVCHCVKSREKPCEIIYLHEHDSGWFHGYGVRSRRTRLLEDQLGRADAGSWQIADRYYMAS